MPGSSRQIVVMGGGGFLIEKRNQRMDRYMLALAKKRSPRVCFVPTATGDFRGFIDRFYAAFKKFDCRPSHLPLFQWNETDPVEHLLKQDIIYVGGGNTANMLAIWRLHGVDRAMRKAWSKGIILCGVSAGMNCWFESSVTDSFGPLKELNDGLGLLKGSACPHYDGEADRRPTYHRLLREKKLTAGVAADDGAAIHFIGTRIFRCVTSKPIARAYQVGLVRKRIVETPLPTIYLLKDGKAPSSSTILTARI
jgi:dipeptidase E